MSARRVVTSRGADEDIAAAVDHLVTEGAVAAAEDLIDALANARDVIARHPSTGSSRIAIETGIAELRDFAVRRFPYVMIYSEENDAARIHRVLHTSRDIPRTLFES